MPIVFVSTSSSFGFLFFPEPKLRGFCVGKLDGDARGDESGNIFLVKKVVFFSAVHESGAYAG